MHFFSRRFALDTAKLPHTPHHRTVAERRTAWPHAPLTFLVHSPLHLVDVNLIHEMERRLHTVHSHPPPDADLTIVCPPLPTTMSSLAWVCFLRFLPSMPFFLLARARCAAIALHLEASESLNG